MTLGTGLLALALWQAGAPPIERNLTVTVVDEKGRRSRAWPATRWS